MGFEPTEPVPRLGGFQDRPFQPLGHPAANPDCSFAATGFRRPARSSASPAHRPRDYVFAAILAGAPNGTSASGTATLPPSSWKFSMIAIIARAVTAVPFRVCTCSSPRSPR